MSTDEQGPDTAAIRARCDAWNSTPDTVLHTGLGWQNLVWASVKDVPVLLAALDAARTERDTALAERDEWKRTYDAFATNWNSNVDALTVAEARLGELVWAEILTGQSCESGKHTDWFVDSEHNHQCPWCAIERAEAAVVTARRDALAATADLLERTADVGWRTIGREELVIWLRARAATF